MWVQSGCGLWLCLPAFIVSTGTGVPAFGVVLSSGGVFLSFCPLSCSSLGALLANMPLFRVLRAFLARFGVVVWVCVVLVICLACVALCACRVRRIKGLRRVCLQFIPLFASIYPFICLSFCPCCPVLVILPILSIVALCGLVVGCFRFFFPYGLYAKRKGAKCLPCVLSCPVVCVQILVQLSKNSLAVYLAFSSSSG